MLELPGEARPDSALCLPSACLLYNSCSFLLPDTIELTTLQRHQSCHIQTLMTRSSSLKSMAKACSASSQTLVEEASELKFPDGILRIEHCLAETGRSHGCDKVDMNGPQSSRSIVMKENSVVEEQEQKLTARLESSHAIHMVQPSKNDLVHQQPSSKLLLCDPSGTCNGSN
ncbi:hypothetical protein MRB53_038744 [Persea americana]|nr:hypothetical protein MRB53_038744 [Persea americana]